MGIVEVGQRKGLSAIDPEGTEALGRQGEVERTWDREVRQRCDVSPAPVASPSTDALSSEFSYHE